MGFSSLFKTNTPQVVGLDISSTAVKLLELGRSGDRLRVESYAVEPLPPNSVNEKNIADVEAVGEAIKRAVKRSGSRSKMAAAARIPWVDISCLRLLFQMLYNESK